MVVTLHSILYSFSVKGVFSCNRESFPPQKFCQSNYSGGHMLLLVCTGNIEEEVGGKSLGSDEKLSLVDKQVGTLKIKERIEAYNSFSLTSYHTYCIKSWPKHLFLTTFYPGH